MCRKVDVVETKAFSPDQFFFKIRAALGGEHKFQVRIYYNRGHVDYAYQLFADVSLLRWDNKEEFHHLETYPHHHHDVEGHVHTSPLIGDPAQDIETVLQAVVTFLEQ
jgi:hypothetical protein